MKQEPVKTPKNGSTSLSTGLITCNWGEFAISLYGIA